MRNCEKINVRSTLFSSILTISIANTYVTKRKITGKLAFRVESSPRSLRTRANVLAVSCGKIPPGNRARFPRAAVKSRGGVSREAETTQPACCINSSHGKPFQFLACSCTSGFCAASRPRYTPGYTLCKQLAAPGAKSFCAVATQVDHDVFCNRATGRDLSAVVSLNICRT